MMEAPKVEVPLSVITQLQENREELEKKYSTVLKQLAEKADELKAKGLLTNQAEEDLEARIMSILDDNTTTRSKNFKTYLAVDNCKFGKPAFSTTRGMMTHTVQLFYPHEDYSRLKISHYVEGVNTDLLGNKSIAFTDIPCKHITAVKCDLLDTNTALEWVRQCNSEVAELPQFTYRVVVTANSSIGSVPYESYRALRMTDRVLYEQLRCLRKKIHHLGSMAPEQVTFEMLVSFHSETDAIKLIGMCHATEELGLKDQIHDPLAMYFTHSPDHKILFPGHVVFYDEAVEPLSGVTHWDNKYQQLVHQVYGSVIDFMDERSNTTMLSELKFDAFAVRLPHITNDAKFLLFVNPGGDDVYLPKDGETCKIRSDSFKFPPEKPEEELLHDKFSTAVERIFEIFKASYDQADDKITWIRAQAPELVSLDDADIFSLLRCYNDGDPEEQSDWESRFEKYFAEDDSRLQLNNPADEQFSSPPTTEDGQPDDDDGKWLSAYRQDVPFVYAGIHMQVYVVSKPRAKKQHIGDSKDVPERPLVNVSIPMLEHTTGTEDIESFMQRTKEMAFQVTITKSISSKTLRSEALAINALAYPPCSDIPMVPTQKSLDAYKYLLDFNAKPEKTVNLHNMIPGIGKVVEHQENTADSPPSWVLDQYRNLNQKKKDAMKGFSSLPHGIGFIAGVAGCGKSTLLKLAILAAQYGHCTTDTKPENAPEPDFSALFIVSNNEGVDKFANELAEMYQELGFKDNAPDVMRLYSIESEVSSMIKKNEQKPQDVFDEEAANVELDKLNVGDHLIAQYQILKLTMNSFNTTKLIKERKHRLRDMSLHTYAFRFLENNKKEYENLWELLKLVDSKTPLTPPQMTAWKEGTKVLYQNFLAQFRGVICTTPVAAANYSVRFFFDPTLVMIDEAARMHEMSTLIGVAWYSPKAWIIVGDVRQLGPHIVLNPDTPNPFRASLDISVLSRAVNAGAVNSYLNANFRQYGDLITQPSELCYLGEMIPGNEERFPSPVKNWIKFCQLKINPSHPNNACRLLQELPGSKTGKIGKSTFNQMHVRWTMDRVKEILKDGSLTGLGKNNGKLVRILILPLYRAQYRQYQLEIEKLKTSKEFTEDEISRIRLHTLDSSQGDEDDIVIADLTKTDEPGFCGDLRRVCLLLTRPAIGQLVLMNRGMWLCSDTNPGVVVRASVLRSVQRFLAKKNCISTTVCCDRCQTFGDHMTINCDSPKGHPEKDGKQSDESEDSGRKPICDNCKARGHTTNECEMEPRCYRCNSKKHICYECTTYAFCSNCQSKDHQTHECPSQEMADEKRKAKEKACRNCGEIGHMRRECPHPPGKSVTCHGCGETGHKNSDCPNPTCSRCKEKGHRARDCTLKTCRRCGKTDHTAKFCPKPLICSACGNYGHTAEACRAKSIRKPNRPDVIMSEEAREKAITQSNVIRHNEALRAISSLSSSLMNSSSAMAAAQEMERATLVALSVNQEGSGTADGDQANNGVDASW